jgi:hypothetical protein
MNTLSQEEFDLIVKMRNNGFCIVIFTPEELCGASSDEIEERLIELGWDVIDSLKTENVE